MGRMMHRVISHQVIQGYPISSEEGILSDAIQPYGGDTHLS